VEQAAVRGRRAVARTTRCVVVAVTGQGMYVGTAGSHAGAAVQGEGQRIIANWNVEEALGSVWEQAQAEAVRWPWQDRQQVRRWARQAGRMLKQTIGRTGNPAEGTGQKGEGSSNNRQ